MTTSARLSPAGHPPGHRIQSLTSIASLALLVLWAGFWLWFSVSVVLSERTLAWQPYAFIATIIGLAAAAWRFPRIGGILMIAAGVAAAYYYDNVWARGLLATPAIVIGAIRAFVVRERRPQMKEPRSDRTSASGDGTRPAE